LKSALAKLEARDDMPPAEQHGEVLRPSGNGRRIWAGAGLLLLVGLGGGYALYRGGGSGAGGGLDGGPATSAATVTAPPVSIAPVVPPPINSSVLSVNPRPPGTLALAPSQPGTRPPDSTPTAASVRPDAPPAPMRGTATLTGSFWSLGVPANAFGSAGYVCLDPSPRPAELMGVQPTCGLAGGAGTALCSRSDKARAISIGTSVPWRSPCP
ncbi:MAG: hypothetical protein ABI193_17760, partial [Minicystis sp.]